MRTDPGNYKILLAAVLYRYNLFPESIGTWINPFPFEQRQRNQDFDQECDENVEEVDFDSPSQDSLYVRENIGEWDWDQDCCTYAVLMSIHFV